MTFTFEAALEPDCPQYASLDDVPYRQVSIIPCETSGPHCDGRGVAYRIGPKGQPSGPVRDSSITPTESGSRFTFGSREINIALPCGPCRRNLMGTWGKESEEVTRAKEAQIIADRITALGIPGRYQDATLRGRMRSAVGDMALAAAKRGEMVLPTDAHIGAVSWLRKWDLRLQSCILMGDKGTGKSYLAFAWALDAVRSGEAGIMVLREQRLQSALLGRLDSEEFQQAKDLLAKARDARVLLWDDLAHIADGYGDKLPARIVPDLTAVIDERYNERRPTIWTTNASWEQLAGRLGDGPVSRIKQVAWASQFMLRGFDFRTVGSTIEME